MGLEQKPVETVGNEAILLSGSEYDDHPQDECGVMGLFMHDASTGQMAYEALRRLQHRGQSGAGIAYNLEPNCLIGHAGNGLIDDAIKEVSPKHSPTGYDSIQSNVVIGHTRYSTANSNHASQPFFGKGRRFALAHNGHIETIEETAEVFGVQAEGEISDSALLTKIIDSRIDKAGSLEGAIAEVAPYLEGGYSIVATDGTNIVAVRDPWGTHPLSLAKLSDNRGYMVASEDTAFKFAGSESIRDVREGEIVTIGPDGVSTISIDREESPAHCMYEYIYFARPGSIINGVKVMRARKAMGKYLAIDHNVEADVVIGVPSSGLAAAAGYAAVSGIPRAEGLIKNDYETRSRSFIHRGEERSSVLLHKFEVDEDEVEGQRVVLVDDSLIKGNTMAIIVGMLRDKGAKEIHVRSAAPQYLYPCYGGMDTRDTSLHIARGRNNEAIASLITANSMAFNSTKRIREALNDGRIQGITRNVGKTICTACHTGDYPYRVPNTQLVASLA